MAKTKDKLKAFVAKWKGKGKEKQETQKFWTELVEAVLGVEHGRDILDFEKAVPENAIKIEDGEKQKYIDCYVNPSKCVIEQKSIGIPLAGKPTAHYINEKGEKVELDAQHQAILYYNRLNHSEQGRYIIVCNFSEFNIFDMEDKTKPYKRIMLEDLPRHKDYLRRVLSGEEKNYDIDKDALQDATAKTASSRIKELYELLLKQYSKKEQTSEEVLHQLNVFCVRVVFCLYADDANLFPERAFHTFLNTFKDKKLQEKFKWLFIALDQEEDKRDKALDEEIKAFPHVNGGLFRDEVAIPRLNEDIRRLMLSSMDDLVMPGNKSIPFSWSEISPTNFGCIFENTLDAKTRHNNGMHYTQPANIHRVIDPLFLNDLKAELEKYLALPHDTEKEKRHRCDELQTYHAKLASFTFLDPACGSGNFLTETFKALRRLEIKTIRALPDMGMEHAYTGAAIHSPLKVSINQFYGIEINDFASQVARAALWISDCQMKQEAEEELDILMNDVLPLEGSTDNIRCADALVQDWCQVVPAKRLSYIIGNPPFLGSQELAAAGVKPSFSKVILGAQDKNGKNLWKKDGNMDHVCAWYAKAADIMSKNKEIKAALVSTNSITQGEQVALLWKPLVESYNIQIDFAWRTFRWENESENSANVHCVIIGFHSYKKGEKQSHKIYKDENCVIECDCINSYLLPAPQYFLKSTLKHIQGNTVPALRFGSMPNDGGEVPDPSAPNGVRTEQMLRVSPEERKALIAKHPELAPYILRILGSEEFLNDIENYCIWLDGENVPSAIRLHPALQQRFAAIRQSRQKSTRTETRKLADTPYLFGEIRQPKTNYIIVPGTSSENRRLIPMGFLPSNIIASNAAFTIENATLYHFGILQSRIHMAWVKVVCGRLKSDYRYSGRVVYNNFPWPADTDEDVRLKIEGTAQDILNARSNNADCSLAQMYNENAMPQNLVNAHRENDRAVFAAYATMGLTPEMNDEDIALTLLQKSVKLATPKPTRKKTKKKKATKAKKKVNKTLFNE